MKVEHNKQLVVFSEFSFNVISSTDRINDPTYIEISKKLKEN